MQVRLGNGNGTFGTASSITATGAFTLGDIDIDGNLDILTSNGQQLIGNGDGTFTAGNTISLPGAGLTVDLEDLNGDGFLDAAFSVGSTLYTYLNDREGGFSSNALQTSTIAGGREISWGDFNEDGAVDLILGYTGSARVMFGDAQVTTEVRRFNLTTQDEALASLSWIDQALQRVGKETGNIGALMSRLETAVAALQTESENTEAANSRITSVDVAEEVAALTRAQILQNMGGGVLAQANLQGELLLKLLR